MSSNKTLTRNQESILIKVLHDVNKDITIDANDAKQTLEAQKSSDIQFANDDLQPVAFAVRYATWKTYFYGIIGEIIAWITLTFSFLFLLIVAALSIALTQSAGLVPRILRIETLKKIVKYWVRGRWVAQRQRFNAYKKLCSDKRKPIIYLRSFSSHYEDDFGEDGRKQDERIAEQFEKDGPVLAIAEPDAKGFMPGPIRLYFDNHFWRAGVIYLMSISQQVIIHGGMTHGTLWELGIARRKLDPQKLVIYVSDIYSDNTKNPNLLYDFTYYHDFKAYAEYVMECDLPRRPSMFIKFDENWESWMYDPSGQWLHVKTAERQMRKHAYSELNQIKTSMAQLYESHWGASVSPEDSIQPHDTLIWLQRTGNLVKKATDIRINIIETATVIISSFRRTPALLRLIEQVISFETTENYMRVISSNEILIEASRAGVYKEMQQLFNRELKLIDKLAIHLANEVAEDAEISGQAAPNKALQLTAR